MATKKTSKFNLLGPTRLFTFFSSSHPSLNSFNCADSKRIQVQLTVWLLVRATCSWWVSESPLTPRGWEAVIGWELLHSHLALIKQCQSVFINCRLLFVKWLFWPLVKMAILETCIESGFCNVSVEFWSCRGGRIGHGQWTNGTTFDAPVALALSSLLLLLSEPAWTGLTTNTLDRDVCGLVVLVPVALSSLFLLFAEPAWSRCLWTGRKWMRGCPTKRERKVNLFFSIFVSQNVFVRPPS